MWLCFAVGSAFFAGITAVLAKIGIQTVNSTLATAIRTVVVLIFSWLLVFVVGSQAQLLQITGTTLCFLILSGLSTGQVFGVLGIGIGTLLMISKKEEEKDRPQQRGWLAFAVLSALSASLTSIFGKIGVEHIESNLGTAICTLVVLVMAWLMVFFTGEQKKIRMIDGKSWIFLFLSGITTGLSWLCYYHALQDGPASVVVPIDKLSIAVTVVFSGIVLKERLSRKAAAGLLLILAGTGAMLL